MKHPLRFRVAWRLHQHWLSDLNESEASPPGWRSTLIARIVEPLQWGPPHPRAIEHAVDCLGLTEADVRDMKRLVNRDGVVIRCWNHRRFTVDGRHIRDHHRH